MKKRNFVLSSLIMVGLFCATLNPVNAQSTYEGKWEYLNSAFSEGEWHILEKCVSSGTDCVIGTYRDITPT